MAEFVDKAKLMNRIESELIRWGESEYNALQILGDIEDFPTADVVEVRHGEWVTLEAEIGLYSCSLCEHKILRAECNYCPNCGAKMDGGKAE